MVEINDESRGTYNKDNQIRFKISMLRSNIFCYSDAYILFNGTTKIEKQTAAAPNNAKKSNILKIVHHLLGA